MQGQPVGDLSASGPRREQGFAQFLYTRHRDDIVAQAATRSQHLCEFSLFGGELLFEHCCIGEGRVGEEPHADQRVLLEGVQLQFDAS